MPWVSSFLKYEWPKVPVSDCSDWPHLKSLTNHRTLYSGQIHLSGSSPRYTYFYLRSNSVARNSAQFRENLIASLFAIPRNKMAQAEASIARNRIAIGNPTYNPLKAGRGGCLSMHCLHLPGGLFKKLEF